METVIAVAVAVVLGWLLLHALAQALLAGRIQSARDLEQSTIGQLTDRLTNEEDDAWAIYVPPSDIFGAANDDGHEVDFFTRDGKEQSYFWAYDYDPGTQTIYRYRFSSPGGAPTKDTSYTGITKFYAHTYPLTALQDASTPVYSTLYNGANLRNGIVHFYPNMPWIAGGNNITYVHFEGATIKQDLELVPQTAPSGFTIVLNYTPSPSPTPTSTPSPQIWPARIVLAAPGMSLTYTGAPLAMNAYPLPNSGFGAMLNRLLGGAVALAQTRCIDPSACVGRTPGPIKTPTPKPATPTPSPQPTLPPVFYSPTPPPTSTPVPVTPTPITTTPTPPPTPPPGAAPTPAPGTCAALAYDENGNALPAGAHAPWAGGPSIDQNGCLAEPNPGASPSAIFWLHEDGSSAPQTFSGPTGLMCSDTLSPGQWYQPDGSQHAYAPTAGQFFSVTGNATVNSWCTVPFLDPHGLPVEGYAKIRFPSTMYADVVTYAALFLYRSCPGGGGSPDCVDMYRYTTTNSGYVSTDQGATWSGAYRCSSSAISDTSEDRPPSNPGCSQYTPSFHYDGGWEPYTPPNPPTTN